MSKVRPKYADGEKYLEKIVDKNIHYKNTLPLLVPVLRHVPQPVEELLGLLEEVAELIDNLPLFLLLHVFVHCHR